MSVSSSVGQRFSQLIQALGMSKNAFAISLDKTATVIQHLVDERNKPGFDLMNKVIDVYPNVSIEWLLRGNGPMLLDGAIVPTAPETPAASVPPAPVPAKAVPVTPGFPTPLFTVSAARSSAPASSELPADALPLLPTANAPLVAPGTPMASPEAVLPQMPPSTTSLPFSAPEVADAPVALAAAPLLPAAQEPMPRAVAMAAALDAATLTAALHAQHLQHQLALAEQRNQHLLEQQKLILERQALMQQMLDLLRRPV